MRRNPVLALALVLSLPATGILNARAGAGQTQQTLGTVSGTASNAASQPLANVVVQLRNLASGQLTATTTSSASGAFTFSAVPLGNFAVEVVNAAGQIIGTSASLTVAAGASLSGITVVTSAALAGAAGSAAAAGVAAAVGGGAVAGETAAVVIASAAGAGLAGAVAVTDTGSPSN